MTLTQRQPRETDNAFLAWVRTLPCTITGRPGPNDPAHIRSAAPQYGKRRTGMGEKPDDRWVLPLSREMHDQQHARGDELAWWTSKGIADPFALAIALYASRPNAGQPKREPRRQIVKTIVRKPAGQRRKIVGGKKLESRPNWPAPGTRKFPKDNRPMVGRRDG